MNKTGTFKMFLVLLTAAVLAVGSEISAAQPLKPLLDTQKVMKVAAGVTRAEFPNADVVLVDDFQEVRFNPDGTSVTTDDFYEKILTEKGRRENSVVQLHFSLSYSQVEVPALEIIRPDGTIDKIDIKKNSRVMVDHSQMGSNIYDPNNKILQITVPGLQVGDVLHTIYVRTYLKVRMKDAYSDFFLLQSTNPIVRYEVQVNAPESLPLAKFMVKDAVKDAVTFKETREDGRIIYNWVVKNIPRIYEEPNMPDAYRVSQRLLVSTVPEWQDISKWYWGLCEPHLQKVTPEMRQKVKDITAGLKDREAQIAAIFQFVSKEIRYMGITTEKVAPGNEPHDVDITFNNRYGVCRDKAALLVAMLRLAGFKAFPVLFYNGPKKDTEVPNNFFNHAICCVQNPDDTYTLMDPTDETTAKLLPSYLCDKSYLVARPEGEPLMTSPVRPAAMNMINISTDGKVSAAGVLEASTVLDFSGINDNIYRGAFSRWKEEERRQFFERAVKRVIPGAELTGLEIIPANLRDMSVPLKVKISYRAADFLIKGEQNTVLMPPWFGRSFGVVSFILNGTGLEKRKYPFRLFTTCGAAEKFSIALPMDKAVLLPDYKTVSDKTLLWEQKLAFQERKLEGQGEFMLKVMEFSPAQYLELKTALKEIEYQKRKMPIFDAVVPDDTKAAAATSGDLKINQERDPEAVILKSDIRFDLQSNSAWKMTTSVSKKILNYAGVKNNSEIKLSYNPAWEDVKIVSAAVTGTDGKVKTVSSEEINLMDASWNGSAPRYSPGKILVASLPGVEIGGTVEYKIEYNVKDRPFFSLIGIFQEQYPIEHKSITVRAPETLGLKIKVDGMVDQGKKSEGGSVEYTFSVKDRPQVMTEAFAPPLWAFVPSVFVSGGDWSAYGAKLSAVLKKAVAENSKVKEFTAGLIKDVKESRDKLLVIRDFAAKNIRRAGPGLAELPLSEISPADVVLAERYGNTTDCAVLLCAMLEAAGFNPEPVLVSSVKVEELADKLRNTPVYPFFDNVLVRVELDGKYLYLNDTDQYAELGTFEHEDCFALTLDGKIVKLEAQQGMTSSEKSVFTMNVKNDGQARVAKAKWFYGVNFEAVNRMFSEMPPELRNRYFQKAVAAVSESAVPEGGLSTDFKSYPGKEEFTVTIPRYAVKQNGFLYFFLPDDIFARILNVGGISRTTPYMMREKSFEQEYIIELPPEMKKVIFKTPFFNWTCPSSGGSIVIKSEKINGNKLRIYCNVNLRSAIIPAKAYNELVKAGSRLSNPVMKLILIAE